MEAEDEIPRYRTLLCAVQTGGKYFGKLLQNMCENTVHKTFYNVLDENFYKHDILHLWKNDNCCLCGVSTVHHYAGSLKQRQILSVYSTIDRKCGRIPCKFCPCSYKAKEGVCTSNIDITFSHALLSRVFLKSVHPSLFNVQRAIDEIKEIRNTAVHYPENPLHQVVFDKEWLNLKSSLLTICKYLKESTDMLEEEMEKFHYLVNTCKNCSFRIKASLERMKNGELKDSNDNGIVGNPFQMFAVCQDCARIQEGCKDAQSLIFDNLPLFMGLTPYEFLPDLEEAGVLTEEDVRHIKSLDKRVKQMESFLSILKESGISSCRKTLDILSEKDYGPAIREMRKEKKAGCEITFADFDVEEVNALQQKTTDHTTEQSSGIGKYHLRFSVLGPQKDKIEKILKDFIESEEFLSKLNDMGPEDISVTDGSVIVHLTFKCKEDYDKFSVAVSEGKLFDIVSRMWDKVKCNHKIDKQDANMIVYIQNVTGRLADSGKTECSAAFFIDTNNEFLTEELCPGTMIKYLKESQHDISEAIRIRKEHPFDRRAQSQELLKFLRNESFEFIQKCIFATQPETIKRKLEEFMSSVHAVLQTENKEKETIVEDTLLQTVTDDIIREKHAVLETEDKEKETMVEDTLLQTGTDDIIREKHAVLETEDKEKETMVEDTLLQTGTDDIIREKHAVLEIEDIEKETMVEDTRLQTETDAIIREKRVIIQCSHCRKRQISNEELECVTCDACLKQDHAIESRKFQRYTGSDYYRGAPPGPTYIQYGGIYPPPPPTHHQRHLTYREARKSCQEEMNKSNEDDLFRDSNTKEKDVSELSVRAKRNLFLYAMKTTKKTPTTKYTVPPKPVRRAWSFQSKSPGPPAPLTPKPKPRPRAAKIKESSKDVIHEFIPEKSLQDGALRSTFEKQEDIEESVHKTDVKKQQLQIEDISPSRNSVERQIDVQKVIQEKPTWDKTQDEGSSDEEDDWEHIPEAEEDEDEKKMMEDFPEDNNDETDKSEIAEGADLSDDSNQQSTVDDTDQAIHLSQNTDISNVSNQLSKHESKGDDVCLEGLQKSTNSTEHERASDIEKSISIDIRKDSITENSVQISWPCKSLKEDEYFVIYYKEEGVKRWKSLEKYLKENHATVSVLESDKTYQFRVKIKDDEHDTITNYSEVSDVVTTHPSEVQIWKKRSKKAKHSDSVWILPTVEVMAARDERHMTRKLVLSDCNEGKRIPQKTILVLGATGSGKSTWIDSLANYVLGAEWDGDRFQIVSLEAVEKQREADPTKSLTEWITCYTIVPSKATEGRLSFILNILDTPGIGDTRGISRDEEIIKQIEGLFHKEGEGSIKHIDAICFVFPAPQTRLTASQRYVCETMVALFGKDVAPNIVTITTFFDGHEPNVLGSLKKLRIPYKPWFAFNNGGLFQNTADQNQSMLREYWKQNVTNFQRLFHTLTCLKPKTLLLTVEVLEKRRSRYHTQDILQTQIKQALDVVWALEQEIAIIVQNKSEIVKNKNFKYIIDDVVLEKRNLPVDATYQATNCKVCKYTCHLECPKDKKNIKTCIAMDQEGYCMSCPKYCHYSKHTKSNVVLERNQRKVEKTFKGKISEYKLGSQRTEDVIDELKERVDNYEKRITSLVSILQCLDAELQEKALRHNPADTADYFDQLIQTEESERKRGYKNRILALEKCKGMDIDKDTKAFFDRAKLAEQKLHEAYQKERRGIFGHIMDAIAKPFK